MDWKKMIGTIAPGLATLLGGPLAGTAVKAIATKLGLAGDKESDVEQALASGATVEQVIALKQLDVEIQKQLADEGITLEQTAAADRANARAREVALHDHTPTVLGALVVVGSIGALAFVFLEPLPKESHDIALAMVASLNTLSGMVMNYYFGSSRGSAAKDETIRNAVAK